MSTIEGFSKLNREQKIEAISELNNIGLNEIHIINNPIQGTIEDSFLQGMSENLISAYILPLSIAPNFNINGKIYFVPMVTEESSVVAAASSAAKFWLNKGGFVTKVISTTKIGQIHFLWHGDFENLVSRISELEKVLNYSTKAHTNRMEQRGGGIRKIELLDFSKKLPHYYQIKVSFETADAMGANFINSILEEMSKALKQFFENVFSGTEKNCNIIMSILSNFNPDCIVESTVKCSVMQLHEISGELKAIDFARKFETAVSIANIDIYRAATHNKGIFNGIDSVIIATGNDYRAVEAGGHAYAAMDGHYKSLSNVEVDKEHFKFSIKVPLSIGTVGGITNVHPQAKTSLKILGNPTAKELMQIAASVGLANNFSAIRALITSGIQKGHMKLHIINILKSLHATDYEKSYILRYFRNKTVSYSEVENVILDLRNKSANG